LLNFSKQINGRLAKWLSGYHPDQLSDPIILFEPPHRRRRRVLDLKPIRRLACLVRHAVSLRHDALAAQGACVLVDYCALTAAAGCGNRHAVVAGRVSMPRPVPRARLVPPGPGSPRTACKKLECHVYAGVATIPARPALEPTADRRCEALIRKFASQTAAKLRLKTLLRAFEYRFGVGRPGCIRSIDIDRK
jgi:hypothetical protein